MDAERRWNCILKGVGWLAGGVDVTFLVALAFALFARRSLTQGNVPYALLGHYLADCLMILGLGGLALTVAWLVLRAKTVCRVQ